MKIVVFVLALVALVIVVSAVRAFFRALRGPTERRAAFPSESNAASSGYKPLTRANGVASKALRDADESNRRAAAEGHARQQREFQRQMAEQRQTVQRMNEDAAKRSRAATQAAIDQAHRAAQRNRGW